MLSCLVYLLQSIIIQNILSWQQQSNIRETLNQLMCADSSNNTKKFPHMDNTQPSCMCVIYDYLLYTMSLSQAIGVNNTNTNTISIPWVHVYTMSQWIMGELESWLNIIDV